MTDLLTTPVFAVDDHVLTLPGVLARLSSVDDVAYRALQAHQHHVWHMFVVQIAVLALQKARADGPFTDEEDWRTALLALDDDPSMWWLDQPDLSRPAFLQPPLPDGKDAFTKSYDTPDALDVLATAKNHDLKSERIQNPTVEHWVHALLGLQTMGNFGGKTNYGIARMNSGYGSRPCISFVADLGWGSRFREDVSKIQRGWEAFLTNRAADGPALLWREPFALDNRQLEPTTLNPLFIEVCRRVRFYDGQWRAGVSKNERLSGKALNGNVGDPWMPLKPNGDGLTIRHLSHTLLLSLLNETRLPNPMQEDRFTRWLVCDVLASDKTETAGFHHRALALPPSIVGRMRNPDQRAQLAALGQQRLEIAGTVRKRCVLPALLKIYDEDIKSGKAFKAHLADFNQMVDDVFFERLWEALEADDPLADWWAHLHSIGQRIVREAIDSAPKRSGLSFKRSSVALSIFEGSFHKNSTPKEA